MHSLSIYLSILDHSPLSIKSDEERGHRKRTLSVEGEDDSPSKSVKRESELDDIDAEVGGGGKKEREERR